MSTADTTNLEVFNQAMADGMRLAGVPKRYQLVEASLRYNRGRWSYITGGVGCGKTTEAAAILRAYLQDMAVSCGDGRFWSAPRAKFVTVSGYLAEVKRGFDGDGDANVYRTTPFLVLDDLGQEIPTQWAVSELFELINHRYAEELQTVITSQFSRGAIARRLSVNGGEEQAVAIASRLAEECRVIDLGSDDRRLRTLAGVTHG